MPKNHIQKAISLIRQAGTKWEKGLGEQYANTVTEIFEEVDWEEKAVTKELAKEFGKKYAKEIRESLSLENGPYSRFGTCGKFTVDGEEYVLLPSEKEAESIALQIVTQDLEGEPEIFNQDWLSNYLAIYNTDRRLLASEEADAYVDDLDEDRVIEEAGMSDEYEEAEEDSKEEVVDTAREKLRESRYNEIYKALSNPIQYFVEDQGIYTIEQLLKASFITIDTESAAEAAIRTDGWAHFISRYNGDYKETDNGLVYFRET